jgi:LmbE family N-acetylglucosaminyl deacetylase
MFRAKILTPFSFRFLIFICALSLLCLGAFAQVRPVYDQGAIGLGQLLKKLQTTASVMHTGAHPDDEDSGLLAYLARREQARTVYLSLTRGDGGQNIIGPELFEPLGVIRTEELLQARRLDGAEQLFTRAFDYGFSKTLAEARAKWGENEPLCDAVKAIRGFRPLVVISRFSGTPADGHGQHQYAGYVTPLAVKAAADPAQCPASGSAWQVKKFYVSQGFRSTAQPSLRLNTGEYDPLIGRSYFEIALEGRSQHKSQEQGVLELRGAFFSGLNLQGSSAKENSVFEGLDVSIAGIAALTGANEPAFAQKLSELQTQIQQTLNNFNALTPQKLLPVLSSALKTAAEAKAATNNPEAKRLLIQKERELSEAIRMASGVVVDALSDRETVVPGETLTATVRTFYPDPKIVKVKEISWEAPAGWEIAKTEEPKEQTAGFFRRETANESAQFAVKVPANAKLTQPYWLESERQGYLFNPAADKNQNAPFEKPQLTCVVKLEVAGTEITVRQPAQYRFADDIRGEIRRDINVVPALAVSLDQKLLIVPQSKKPQTRRLVVTVTNNSAKAVKGTVGLNFNTPKDLPIAASSKSFEIKNKGEKTSLNFDLTIPANMKSGGYEIYAQATMQPGNAPFTGEMSAIAYPHIQTHRYYTRSETRLKTLDLKTVPLRIGYIAGSGDAVPQAIRQMGYNLEFLDEKELTGGDLARFDTIVIGIRASQVRPDFVANNQRLLDYAKGGGTLLVQYQLPLYAQQNLLPYPAQMGARVTDENAKVTILEPKHPAFNFPNKITDADFAGWVQERNLYNFNTYDAAKNADILDANYKPLLESHDANEAENKGGLVVADLGKGKYVYCSYSFFRQLPAGVPGAYRLFANLLSISSKRGAYRSSNLHRPL